MTTILKRFSSVVGGETNGFNDMTLAIFCRYAHVQASALRWSALFRDPHLLLFKREPWLQQPTSNAIHRLSQRSRTARNVSSAGARIFSPIYYCQYRDYHTAWMTSALPRVLNNWWELGAVALLDPVANGS